MKLIIKNIIYLALICLITSCNNSFLDDNISPDQQLMGYSNIYVSPNWESAEYQFNLSSLIDNDYEIIETPSWLQIDTKNGSLSGGLATVNCSAINCTTYNQYGIYIDFMTVKADNKNYKVTVAYVNEGEPLLKVENTLDITYETTSGLSLPIQNRGKGILRWKLTSLPDWLAVDTAQIDPEQMYLPYYHDYYIPLKIIQDKITSTISTGTIVLSSNDTTNPEVQIEVTVNLGSPKLTNYTNEIIFHPYETSKSIHFSNHGEGILIWEFTDIPEWLTITPTSGIYSSYTTYDDIVFKCDRTKLPSDQFTATVNLKSNNASGQTHGITINVITSGDSEYKYAIEGQITDALFNKNTNTLYYTTTSPNKLITLDINTKEVLNEIYLSQAPNCIAISEDWTKAAIGHNGYISGVDLTNNSITSEYTIDYSVYDISWGENDWFCFSQKSGSFTSVHYINTADGTLYDDPGRKCLDDDSILKKVPGEPYIIATSQSGLFAFDIATKSIKSYSRYCLTNFWLSEDSEYIFSRHFNIYRTASLTESNDISSIDINPIARITTESESFGFVHMYHSNNSIWVIQPTSYFDDKPSNIYQIEDNDFTFEKKIIYDLYYHSEDQITETKLSANYVFANNEGTEVVVLCKGISNDTWVIQYIDVQ